MDLMRTIVLLLLLSTVKVSLAGETSDASHTV